MISKCFDMNCLVGTAFLILSVLSYDYALGVLFYEIDMIKT